MSIMTTTARVGGNDARPAPSPVMDLFGDSMVERPTKPAACPVMPEGIPVELKTIAQWVLWRWVRTGTKWTKVPFQANEHKASSADAHTWTTFDKALAAYQSGSFDGIGFVVTERDPYVGIDLDKCIDEAWPKKMIAELDSYAECTPSGNGYRVWIRGTLEDFKSKSKHFHESRVELYDRGRYFTVTGHWLEGSPAVINERQKQIESACKALLKSPPPANDNSGSTPMIRATTTREPMSADRIRQCLEWIPNAGDGQPYEDDSGASYMGVMMSVHHETNGAGFDLFNAWSARCNRHNESENRRKWESCSPNRGYTGGSLVHWALQGGMPAHATTGGADATRTTAPESWPEPQPLVTAMQPTEYPLDALPDVIRHAVEEVQGFVQAPIPMVASSALSAVSLACQAHFDVQRTVGLEGPISLYLLTIADSGERKSTCDGYFKNVIEQWQADEEKARAPETKKYNAENTAWLAEKDGIVQKIKAFAKDGKSTTELKKRLVAIEAEEPQPPRIPRMLLTDESPQALAWSLAKKWPSAGILSAEAGAVLGSHAMKEGEITGNLSLQNILWDGGELNIGRKTSESFSVRGARLTVGLQVQSATIRDFYDKNGNLARGTGFMARFLVAWPDSTQGYRPFREASGTWPRLSAFNVAMKRILETPPPILEDGTLEPEMLRLSPDAKKTWVAFHDAIESELRTGGELHAVRDVASKIADNAARLAGLFHVISSKSGTSIDEDTFEGAASIAAWHLYESRRFFGEIALPTEYADANRLERWLIGYCRTNGVASVPRREAHQSGPLRDGKRLQTAIIELCNVARLAVVKSGKKITLHLNPALLENGK